MNQRYVSVDGILRPRPATHTGMQRLTVQTPLAQAVQRRQAQYLRPITSQAQVIQSPIPIPNVSAQALPVQPASRRVIQDIAPTHRVAQTHTIQQPQPRQLTQAPARASKPLPSTQTHQDPQTASRTSATKRLGRFVMEFVQYPLFAGIALIASNNTTLGQYLILAYAILSLVLRKSSRITFGIALFLLVAIPVFQALNQPGVAQNIAVYVYELLVVGTIQAIIELYKNSHNQSFQRDSMET